MNIPPEYQVFIASFIVMLVFALFKWIKAYNNNKDKEPQRLAWVSIMLGLFIFVPFLGGPGLVLALISLFVKKNKRLSKVAVVVNVLSLLPWLAVLIFGA